jgi:preprotein translocase subunit YajC
MNLRKGDEVVTVGGIVGEILKIKETLKEGIPQKTLEDRVTLKTGDSTVVVHRGRIHQVIKSSGVDASAA